MAISVINEFVLDAILSITFFILKKSKDKMSESKVLIFTICTQDRINQVNNFPNKRKMRRYFS